MTGSGTFLPFACALPSGSSRQKQSLSVRSIGIAERHKLMMGECPVRGRVLEIAEIHLRPLPTEYGAKAIKFRAAWNDCFRRCFPPAMMHSLEEKTFRRGVNIKRFELYLL